MRLIDEKQKRTSFREGGFEDTMNNGASSYRRFIEGDQNGIVDIIRDYKDGLILFLNGYTRNICLAEELMEETFVRLVVKKPKYSPKCSFKTWLYTIGRNITIDYLRRNSKTVDMSAEEMQNLASDEESLERSYIQEEQKLTVHKAMNRLNADYRQVLFLSFFEDLNTEQIASVMRKSKRQIGNLMYRAKAALKSELEKEGFIYEDL